MESCRRYKQPELHFIEPYEELYPSVAHIRRSYGTIANYVAYLNERREKSNKDLTEEIRRLYPPYDSAKVISQLQSNRKNSASEKHYYYITYFNKGGRKPRYWQFGAFPSEINGVRFLNINYWDQPAGRATRDTGYLLVKLLRISPKQDTVTTALVSDPYLKTVKSSPEVRESVTKNLNNKEYYSDTVHFYKVRGGKFGQLGFDEAMKLANQ